jgi:capsular exopolysaccharide synthesis family protein
MKVTAIAANLIPTTRVSPLQPQDPSSSERCEWVRCLVERHCRPTCRTGRGVLDGASCRPRVGSGRSVSTQKGLTLSEASTESTVRLGPVVAHLVRSVWRQRLLVIIGLLLGLALGVLGLPKVLNSRATYEATQRMQVLQSPADAIFQIAPAISDGESATPGGSTELLRDLEVANQVVRELPAGSELTGTMLLNNLNFTPLGGSSYVDVSYSSGDPNLATTIVQRYARRFADKRNTSERERLDKALAQLQDYAARLKDSSPQSSSSGDGSSSGSSSGTPSPFQSVIDQITAANVKQAITGPPTAVVGLPIVAKTGNPVSRQVTLALGLMLGLAIGAGAGLLLETGFRKVINQADAEEASGLPFIGAVRKNGIRHTSLPVIERPFCPAAEDYRRVGTALERQGLGEDIKVLAIISADPGEGKTILAANLAHSLARQGRDVILVSSDLRRAQVEKLLGLRPRPGLAEALQDDASNVIAQLVSINEHLLVLPAGLPTKHPGELLASQRLVEIITSLRQFGGIVILDTPPVRLSADAIALSGVADATLVVARSGATRLRSLREATVGLRRDRIRQLGVVLVGTNSPLLRVPYGHREHPETSEVGASERELLVRSRPVQLLTPRRAPSPEPPHASEPQLADLEDIAGEPQR